MYSQTDIEEAVSAGALTADQAASLRNHVAARTGTPTADDEPARWLGGFNDVYIYASSIILLLGIAWLGSKIDVGGRGPSFFIPLLVVAASWGLCEYFGKKKRLALATILFTMAIVYGTFFTMMLLATQVIDPGSGGRATVQLILAVCAAIAAAIAFVHWKRFAAPVAVGLGATMAAIAVMALVGAVVSSDPDGTISFAILTILGFATLAYALTWEAKDLHRVKVEGDVALWLQFAAAWEVVFGVMGLLGLYRELSTGAAVGGIAIFIVAAIVGLATSRRVWPLFAAWPLGMGLYTLVSGGPSEPAYDTYGAYPGANPYSSYGSSPSPDDIMLTLLIVGIVLLLLGAFWTQLRAGIVKLLPAAVASRVPAVDQVAVMPAAAAPQ